MAEGFDEIVKWQLQKPHNWDEYKLSERYPELEPMSLLGAMALDISLTALETAEEVKKMNEYKADRLADYTEDEEADLKEAEYLSHELEVAFVTFYVELSNELAKPPTGENFSQHYAKAVNSIFEQMVTERHKATKDPEEVRLRVGLLLSGLAYMYETERDTHFVELRTVRALEQSTQ
jgi:hypothetical protein